MTQKRKWIPGAAMTALATLLAIATASCSDDTLSLAEYVALCDREVESDDETWVTFGEYANYIEEVYDEYRQIEPPAEVRQFHRASVIAIGELLSFARSQGEDEPYNAWALFAPAMAAAAQIEAAQDGLNPETRQLLIDSGCIDDEDGQGEQDES